MSGESGEPLSQDPIGPSPGAFLSREVPGEASRVYALNRELLRIGRAPESDIVLNDPQVSRQHAEIFLSGKAYLVRDVGSRNGTYLNGVSLVEAHILESGDILTIGSGTLRFDDSASTLAVQAHSPLLLNDRTGEVRVGGELVNLTPKEYTLLRLLVSRSGAVCERDEIARSVWPEYEGQVADYNIDNLVARLRPKIEQRLLTGLHIVAIKKRGYRLQVTPVEKRTPSGGELIGG